MPARVEKLFGAPGTPLGGAAGGGGFLSWITGGYAKGAAFEKAVAEAAQPIVTDPLAH